jgi:DNA-binding MarR family transcriptional regulator
MVKPMAHVQLLSRNLKQVANLYTKILVKELAARQLDQHYEILLILAEQQLPVTQSKLAELLRVDKSRMVSIIYELEQKELISIKRNPADRREHYINLSDTALATISAIGKIVDKVNKQAKAGISPEKLQVFFEVSGQLQQNLEKDC